MLCVIIFEIFTSWAPINVELFFADSVGQPMVSYVHCFGPLLFDSFVHDVICSGVLRSQRRWGLYVAELVSLQLRRPRFYYGSDVED
jgi:hypothetical protein